MFPHVSSVCHDVCEDVTCQLTLGISTVYKLSCTFLWLLRICVMKCWQSASHQMLISSPYMKIGHVSHMFRIFVIFVYVFNLWPRNHQPIDNAVQHVTLKRCCPARLTKHSLPDKLLCVQAAKWMKENSKCSVNRFLKCACLLLWCLSITSLSPAPWTAWFSLLCVVFESLM